MKAMTTIGTVVARGERLFGICIECGRERTFDPARVALPPGLTLEQAGYRMRCRGCGSNQVALEIVPAPDVPGAPRARIDPQAPLGVERPSRSSREQP